MAYEIPGFKLGTLPAAADLSGAQYKAVKAVNTSGAAEANLAGLGEGIAGILQNKPVAGEACEIMTSGVSKAQADSALVIGNKLSVSADGQLKVAATGEKIIGTALSATGAAGELVSVLLKDEGISA